MAALKKKDKIKVKHLDGIYTITDIKGYLVYGVCDEQKASHWFDKRDVRLVKDGK